MRIGNGNSGDDITPVKLFFACSSFSYLAAHHEMDGSLFFSRHGLGIVERQRRCMLSRWFCDLIKLVKLRVLGRGHFFSF